MLELSNKMRMLYGNPTGRSDVFSNIFFGSTDNLARYLDLNRARIRIGVWPIISSSEPETAMGVATVLCLLLENYTNIEVYRLFTKLDGEPQLYQWSMSESQFDVDDWHLDALGENVAIWGKLDKNTDGWMLRLEVENDLIEGDGPKSFDIKAKDLNELTGNLPKLTETIIKYVEATEMRPLAQRYTDVKGDNESLGALYKNLFQWELRLILQLWGQSWSQEAITAARKDLIDSAEKADGEFEAWAVSRAVGRAMLPGFQPVGESLVAGVPELVETFADYSYPPVMLAVALFRLGYHQEAYDLLEESVEEHSDDLTAWLALAELYLADRQLLQMIQTFQRAIDEGVVNTALYMRYAEMLRLLGFENYPLNDFMLIAPEDFDDDENLITWETIEAYEEVLKLDASHQEALYQQALQMADVVDERFWDKFEQLVALDKTGEKVRSVIDSLYNFEEISDGVEVLKKAITGEPNRADLRANLAAIYLFSEDGASARKELEIARKLTDDKQVLVDIDRLMLSAADPEFETSLGELTDLINAGSELDIEDVEYLEDIVEKAPGFAELYVLLGRAYLAWNEPSTALETLLDGQKQAPDDPDILELLGRVLWELDQRELAFEYLNKGLAVNPSHVALLARMGRCRFDNDEIDWSKAYLLRAEAINPRHPALNETRMYISRRLEAGDED